MRAQTIVVTRRCNQRCGFCDRVSPNSADPPLAALTAQVAAAIGRGVRRLILSGGEPLLRPDLIELVRFARAGGAEAVELQTNGTLIASAQAASGLRDAGVSEVQLSLVTTSAERHASLTAARTHPREILRGAIACLDAGLPVSIRLPIAAGLPAAAGRMLGLAEAIPRLRSFVLAPVGRGEPTLRGEQALAPAELSSELLEAYDAAQRRGLALSISPEHALAPCLVPLPLRARRLLASQLRESDEAPNQAHEACARCALARRCTLSAAQLERAGGGGAPTPIIEGGGYLRPGRNAGSRLRVLQAADVETFFHVDYDYGVETDQPTSRIGIIYRCNQVCTFCELADMDVDLSAEKIRAAIDAARGRGSRRLIVTGGEPTLSRDLVDHVRYARDRGFTDIELQTNAVLLDRSELVAALRGAGLTRAQISLHGPDALVSDRLTAAPGTHRRTLAGVTNLLEAGVVCLLNHLIFKDNAALLVDFVEMVERLWGRFRERVVLQFHSPRNEFVDRAEGLAHIARYTDYAETLRRAIDRARELGYSVRDLQDPTGIPALCVLGGDERYLGPILAQAERPRLHAWESDWVTRVEACKTCDASGACMGVPRHYLALHGDGEFQAIRRLPQASGA